MPICRPWERFALILTSYSALRILSQSCQTSTRTMSNSFNLLTSSFSNSFPFTSMPNVYQIPYNTCLRSSEMSISTIFQLVIWLVTMIWSVIFNEAASQLYYFCHFWLLSKVCLCSLSKDTLFERIFFSWENKGNKLKSFSTSPQILGKFYRNWKLSG